MKRFLNFLLRFILIITLTACTNNVKQKTPLEVLDEVMHNTKEVNNLQISFGLDTKFIQDGMEVEMPLSLSIKQNFVNTKNYKAIINLSDNPFIGSQTFYINLTEETSNIYMPGKLIASMVGVTDDSEKWIAEKIEISEEDFNAEEVLKDYEKIDLKTLLKEDEFVLVEEGNDVNKYQLKITKDLLVRIQNALEFGDNEEFEELTETVLVDVYIDVKNNRITKLEIDLKDLVSKILTDNSIDTSDVNLGSIEKLKLNFEIKYDNVKVEIPEIVINNAMTAEEYGNYLTGKMQG